MQKLRLDVWLVRAVQTMYKDAVTLQAITVKFKMGCPWELLYVDDLVLKAESLPVLEKKFQIWKQGRWPCLICRKDVGRNFLRCTQCKLWTHKRCSNIRGRLTRKIALCMEDAQVQ
uniref:Phorbol-ester/DAG-type domain-containing protein n=1 Tax=Octopus bimaculoides TaxID=37653 RepID=A0A0L8H2E7_OCTBM